MIPKVIDKRKARLDFKPCRNLYYWGKNQHIANDFLTGKTVLELGSGTGIVGISASTFNPKRVYLTDLPQFLKILEINLEKNVHVPVTLNSIEIRKLQWDSKQDMEAISGIDTIIGSQLAYDKENVIRLMKTIKHYREINPKLKVVIAYQRYVQEWKNLHKKFQEYFPGQYKQVQWGLFDEDYRDDHIGILYMD